MSTFSAESTPSMWDLKADPTASVKVELTTGERYNSGNLTFDVDGRWVLSGLYLRKLPEGKHPEAPIRIDHYGSSMGSRWRFARGGRVLLALGYSSTIAWDLASPDVPSTRVEQEGKFTISDDSRWLSITSKKGEARLWDLSANSLSGQTARLLPGGPVAKAEFSPGSKILAVGSVDGTVRLIDLSGPPDGSSRVLGAGNAPVEDMIFSPKGRWLLATQQG